METHAHHLHKAPGQGLKHYFFEFFMLFLAVFCGLLAENWREHTVDKKRELEYMRSQLEDLKTDTLEIEKQIILGTKVSMKADSLVNLLNSENPEAHVFDIYRLNGTRVVMVQLEDRTSSQLKNSGGMLLIRNNEVADALRKYWYMSKVLEDIAARIEELSSQSIPIWTQIFSNKYFINIDEKNPIAGINISPKARFVNAEPKLISQYSNLRYSKNQILKNYINFMKMEKFKAIELIKLIKENYHLE